MPHRQTSGFPRTGRTKRNTHWIAGGTITVLLAAGLAITALPLQAGAFWFFPSASASTGFDTSTTSSGLALLHAATNPDPNPARQELAVAMTGGSALIADAGPDGTAADITPATGGQISLYVVRPGDSLSEIAHMFGVSVNTILWANNIRNPSLIKPGDTLLILPVSGVRHTVVKGETIASIAKKYHGNADDIALYNGLDTNAKLTVGSTIIIPGGEMPLPKPIVRSAAVTRHGRITKAPANPYRGGSGPFLPGFFADPLPGAIITQTLHGWNAYDIGAPVGTPIHAAAAGRVIVSRVGGWNGGYGNYVVINHGNGTQTLYAHMHKDISHVGEQVQKGQIIGYVGETGEATGPHLHFEVRGAKNPFAGCHTGQVDTRCFLH